MNEQAIIDSYNIAVQNGYKKSIDEFKSLLSTNSKALNDVYNLAVKNGYSKTLDDYKVLMGVSASPADITEQPKKKEDTTGLPSGVGSSASSKLADDLRALGIKVEQDESILTKKPREAKIGESKMLAASESTRVPNLRIPQKEQQADELDKKLEQIKKDRLAALSTPSNEEDYFQGTFGDMLRAFDSVSPIGIGDFVDDMARAVASGYRSGDVAQAAGKLILSGTTPSMEEIQNLIDKQEKLQQIGSSKEFQDYQKIYEKEGKGVWGFISGISQNPSILPEVMASSIVSMATNTDAVIAALGAIATGATIGASTVGAAGATAGSVVPVAGTAAGGAAGFVSGGISGAVSSLPYAFGLASTILETGSTFAELLQEEVGTDESGNPIKLTQENVRAVLEDPEKYNDIRNKAIARGIAIGVIDTFTAKLAAGVGTKILKQSAAKSATGAATKQAVVGATAAGGAIESAGGSLGEAAARGLIGQEMDTGNILLEGIAEMPGSVRSSLTAMLRTPTYKVGKQNVSAQEMDNLIETMTPEQLVASKIVIDNDFEGRKEKMQDKIISGSIAREIKEAQPDLNEPTINAIVVLQKELNKLEGNKTQVAKDRAAQIRADIKNLQENPLPEPIAPTAKPSYKVNGEEVSADVIDNLLKTKSREELLTLNIQISNDTEGRVEKFQEIIQPVKTQEDAVQKQAAGQVPVQPEARVGQEVAQGEPQAEPQGVTQEGQKEIADENVILSGLRDGFKAVTRNSFDIRSDADVMQNIENRKSFTTSVTKNGKKYLVVGLKLKDVEATTSGRDGYSFAAIEDDGNLPSNAVDVLTQKAVSNVSSVYPNIKEPTIDMFAPVEGKQEVIPASIQSDVDKINEARKKELDDFKGPLNQPYFIGDETGPTVEEFINQKYDTQIEELKAKAVPQEELDLETKLAEDLDIIKSEITPRLRVEGIEIPAEEDIDIETIETNLDRLPSYEVNFTTPEVSQDIQVNPIEESKSQVKEGTAETRPIESFEGVPMVVGMSDILAAGKVTDSMGNPMDVEGGLLYNVLGKNKNAAWAGVTQKGAQTQYNEALQLYKNNKNLFEKLWAEGKLPNGHVPMAIMKMADTAVNSNEAVYRYLNPLVKSQPEANQKAALDALKGDIEVKKKVKQKATVKSANKLGEFISKNNISSLGQLLDAIIVDANNRAKGDTKNTLSLTERSLLFDLMISPQGIKEASKNTVNALFGSKKDPRAKAFLADTIYNDIAEPSMMKTPKGNIVAVVGIDVLNGGVIPVEHGNYGFGPKGQMIALISNPKHGLDVFPEWKAKAARVFKKSKGGAIPSEQKIADEVGGAFYIDKAFRGAKVSMEPSDVELLSAKLRFAFPDVTISNSKEEFDRVLQEEGVRTKESGGKVILGMTKDGKVYLNPESDSLATPIHEFGHIWIDFLRSKASGKKGDALLSKGLSLVEGTKVLQQAIAKYGDNALAREEALVELMATKGETIINKSKQKEFKNWLNALFKYIKEFFITSEQLFKGTDFEQKLKAMSLDDFINIGLADLLKGKEVSSKFKAKEAAAAPKARSSKAQRLAPNGKPSNLSEAQWNQVRTPEFKKWFGDWENDPENASKVVDENGEPLVMYHGSPSVDIESFDIDKGVRQKSGLREFANYFTSNKKLADLYRKSPLSKEYKNEIENLLREAREKRSESRSNATWNFYTQEIDRLNSLFEGKIYEVFLNVKSPFEFNGGNLDMKGWDNASLDIGYKTVTGKAGVIEALSGNNSAYKNTEYDGLIATNLADMFYGTTNKTETIQAVKDLTGTVVAIWDPKQIKSATENVGTFDTGTPNIRFRVGDNVQSFINKARAQGYSEAAIKNVLTRSGVDPDTIDAALAKAEPAAKKVEVTEEFAPGYNRVLNEIFGEKGVVARSRERGRSEEEAMQNAIDYLEQDTKVYENATDVQREAMVRNLRKEFKKREKAAPSAEKVVGKPKKKEVTVDEMAALKDQIKLEARAAREAKADLNTKRKMIADAINKMATEGKITTKKAEAIIKRANKLNVDSEVSVNKFIDYVSKVFADAEYASKLSTGNALRKKIKSVSKNKDKAANLRDLGVKFSEIDPSMVEDIEQYNTIAKKIFESINGSTLKGGVKFADIVKISDVSDYINDAIEKQNKEILNNKIAEMSELLGIEITEDEYFMLMESINNNEDLPKKYKDGGIRKAINKAFDVYSAMINQMMDTGVDPITGEDVSIDAAKKKVVSQFMDMDLSILSDKESLAAIDSLLNFIQNGSTAKMAAVYSRNLGEQKAVRLDKKNFKSSKIKKYFSEDLGKFLVEQFTPLDIVMERMFKGVEKAGDFMFESGISALKKGKSLAQSLNNKIVDKYYNTFYKTKPNNQDFNTLFNTVERGMTAYMMRTKAGSESDINADFKRRKSLIKQSIENLNKGNDKNKKLAEVYSQVYDKILDSSNNYDDVVNKSDSKNVDAVRFWQSEWANKYPELSDLSESIYNKTLGNDLNYTPDKVSNIGKDQKVDEDSDEINRSAMSFHSNNQTAYQRETGVLMKPTLDDKLPSESFIDLSFDSNNANSMYDALVDLNTANAVRQISGFFNSDAFKNIVPNIDDRKILKGRVNLFIRNIRNKNPYDNDEFAKAIRGLQNLAALGAGRALAGPTQALKQTIPVIANTIVNAGSIDLAAPFNEAKTNFINNSGYAIANRSAASINQIETLNKLSSKVSVSLPSKMANPLLQLNELQLKYFLQKPDAYVARAAWITYYEKSLKQQGIDTKSIDYATHELNDKAADYAQRMVDRQQNISDMDLAGKFVGSKNPIAQFINKTIMPFSSFRINQSARMGSDWATLTSKTSTKEDKVIAARSLGGFFVELATFRSVSATLSVALASLATLISGGEDDEEDREKLFDMTIKGATTSTIIDIVSFLPYMDGIFQAGIAKGLDVVQDMLDVEDADKFPFYNPRDKSVLEGLGMLGIAGQRATEFIELIDIAYTRDYKDDFGRTKYISEEDSDILKKFVMLNILSSVGIASPEIKTMTRRTLSNVKRRSTTNESGIKEKKGSFGGGGSSRGGGMNKTDMKKYNPELYNQMYGPGSAAYEVEQEVKAFEKEQRKMEEQIKKEIYGGR